MKATTTLLILFAAISPAPAQTESKATLEKEIQQTISAHQETMTAFMERVRALPREEQREFYQTNYPKPDATRKALDIIVDANPKNPAVLDAVSWIARNTRGAGLDADDYANLTWNHLDNEKLAPVVLALAYSRQPEAISFLKTVGGKSKNKDLRGTALYALSIGLKGDPSKAAEHEATVERIIADHPGLTIRGRNIAKALTAKRNTEVNLAIGKVAPEIIGKDVDGKEMKLSDYKGKIVVLDFWGDW